MNELMNANQRRAVPPPVLVGSKHWQEGLLKRTGLEDKMAKGHRVTTYRHHHDLATSLNILLAGGAQL